MTTFQIGAFIGALIMATIFYFIGKKRKLGGIISFTIVFFMGIIGMIIVLCSPYKTRLPKN